MLLKSRPKKNINLSFQKLSVLMASICSETKSVILHVKIATAVFT